MILRMIDIYTLLVQYSANNHRLSYELDFAESPTCALRASAFGAIDDTLPGAKPPIFSPNHRSQKRAVRILTASQLSKAGRASIKNARLVVPGAGLPV